MRAEHDRSKHAERQALCPGHRSLCISTEAFPLALAAEKEEPSESFKGCRGQAAALESALNAESPSLEAAQVDQHCLEKCGVPSTTLQEQHGNSYEHGF